MVWDLKDVRNAKGEQMYGWAKAYAAENGRLPLWSRNQCAPDGRTMDGWIGVQRIRLSTNKVPAHQKRLLNEIGIYCYKKRQEKPRLYQVAA